MITTGGTIERSVNALLEQGAKEEIYVAATHPVLVESAIERLSNPAIKNVLVTNTIPVPSGKMLQKLRVVSIAHLIADAIRSIHTDSSVSQLFI